MDIISLENTDRKEVDRYIKDEWGGPTIVTLGNVYNSDCLPGFAALENGQIIGAILYRISGNECEISILYSLSENRGIGTSLINQVVKTAKACGCYRVWLVTTNDNTLAIRYYQKYGFDLKAVHINSFDIIRQYKKRLPEKGIDGIPLKHEFEFELLLNA